MNTLPESKLTKQQTKLFQKEITTNYGDETIEVSIRYDDQCGNGHNTFSITTQNGWDHDSIVKYFPEFEYLIKWHGCTSEGPLHYTSNTLYHASEKDYNGCLKGEPYLWDTCIKFGDFPITFKYDKLFTKWLQLMSDDLENPWLFSIIPVEHTDKDGYQFKPKYTFEGFTRKWHECPFDTLQEITQFKKALSLEEISFVKTECAWGEGKESDLKAARDSAIWPDASLTQLQDKQALKDRLPSLMERFKLDMESLGFEY